MKISSLRNIFKNELQIYIDALNNTLQRDDDVFINDDDMIEHTNDLLSQCTIIKTIVNHLNNDAMTTLSTTLFKQCDKYVDDNLI